MNFGQALEFLKDGYRIKRKGWGGYWYLEQSPKIHKVDEEGFVRETRLNPTILAFLKDNGGIAPAQAFQEDMLSSDWLVEDLLKDGWIDVEK